MTTTKHGQLLIAATGYGKTFIAGAVLARLLEIKFHIGKTFTPWPYVYVTRASVVEQTKRVFSKQFGIDCENEVLVINIEQLRSSFGERFVREEVKIEFGEEHYIWKWRPNLFPVVIMWDESQALKNVSSQQSQIAQSYNDIISPHTYQIFISATPYTRVSEAKCFCVSTRMPYAFIGSEKSQLTNKNWETFAKIIADPADPIEYSPAAVDRLTTVMDDYIVRVKGVHPQFKAINKVQMISFQSVAEREFYDKAWERYLEEKAKLEEDPPANSQFLILVEMLKFAQAAEECRAPYLAKAMWEAVTKHNQAACCAVKFKRTIIKAIKILCYDYNIPRELISIIWGGGQTISKKQKLKSKITANQAVLDALTAAGVTMKDIDLDDIDAPPLEELPPELELGIQNAKTRQKEIDKFQSGKSLYCFYTFRAGGVGLSLHHTDEFTKEKVRHKESGYAFVEDIPKIPTRQRINFVAPTYSAIEMVQGLGRCPRLTSLSDTPQLMIFYRGTIEERIAAIVSMKLKCLTKVIRQKESWEDVIVSNKSTEHHMISDVQDEEDTGIYGDTEEENGD